MTKKKAVETHLSRSEVLELVFGKLQIISGECEEAQGREDYQPQLKDLRGLQTRLRRIAVEAKRAASLIETHTHVATAGHCTHCGKTYAEHLADDGFPEGHLLARQPAKRGTPEQPRCLALQRLFDSVELETYQPLKLEVSE